MPQIVSKMGNENADQYKEERMFCKRGVLNSSRKNQTIQRIWGMETTGAKQD